MVHDKGALSDIRDWIDYTVPERFEELALSLEESTTWESMSDDEEEAVQSRIEKLNDMAEEVRSVLDRVSDLIEEME